MVSIGFIPGRLLDHDRIWPSANSLGNVECKTRALSPRVLSSLAFSRLAQSPVRLDRRLFDFLDG